jgi:hypothetical protein
MAAKTWAYGTKIKRLNPVTLVYEEVPSLGDITGPELSRDWLDQTTHDSPGGYEEGIPTILRTGETRAPIIFDPSNSIHASLLADLNTNSKRTWRIVTPTPAADYLQFEAFVTGLGNAYPVAGSLARNFVLRITGLITAGVGG